MAHLSKIIINLLFRNKRGNRCIVPALLFFFFVSYNISWNPLDNQIGSTKNPHVFQSVVHAKNMPRVNQTEWYIRLSVAMPSNGLKDSSNTLGINPKSSFGQDILDISDQPRPPWIENYLDFVFPHPEWDGELTDLSSDFRVDADKEAKVERWHFEVRSNVLNEDVNFSWHGPSHILARCQLRDGRSGQLLVLDPLKDGYTFTMTAPVHEFIWEYNY